MLVLHSEVVYSSCLKLRPILLCTYTNPDGHCARVGEINHSIHILIHVLGIRHTIHTTNIHYSECPLLMRINKSCLFVISHGRKHRSWRVFFPWVSVLPIFGSNGAGVPSFGFRPSFLVPSFVRVSFDGRYPGSRSCPVATYE